MNNLLSRLPSLSTLAWLFASLIAFVAFLFVAPVLFNRPNPNPTPIALELTGSPAPRGTPAATRTILAPPPLPREQTPLPLPTVAPGAKLFTFIADPTQSGYMTSGDAKPRWGDRNLHAGFYNGQRYESVLLFDIAELPPNSKILYADLQLTGLGRDNIANAGDWQVSMIEPAPNRDWKSLPSPELSGLPVLTAFKKRLHPVDVDLRVTNQFVMDKGQLPILEEAINESAFVAFRVQGPTGPDKNLFTWDGGGLDLNSGAHPLLNVIAVPSQFTVITNTPTPENVITAAAIVVRITADATRLGTATPLPRNLATVTPMVIVTAMPTAQNVQTRVALAEKATAIAITTGTYTPTPINWIEVTSTFTPFPTRTPPIVPLDTYIAQLSPTPTPRATPGEFQLLATPVPDFLKGRIVFLTDGLGSKVVPLAIRPDGSDPQVLTGTEAYTLVFTRETYSPDRKRQAFVSEGHNERLQIWILDLATGTRLAITRFTKGVAYDPAWSPDGGKIAFVATETSGDEIYVYDLGAETIRRLTDSSELGQPWNKHPSWSPDSKQIVFWSSRSGHPQIWMMNADGTNLHRLWESETNDTDPVWIKE